MNSEFPKYADDPCYKILSEFAQRMGLKIVYRPTDTMPANALAYIDEYWTHEDEEKHIVIIMPTSDDEIVVSGKEPAIVLAHELVHHLIDGYYFEAPIKLKTAHFLLENDCDRLGRAIYLLAQTIAIEQEAYGEQDDESI